MRCSSTQFAPWPSLRGDMYTMTVKVIFVKIVSLTERLKLFC